MPSPRSTSSRTCTPTPRQPTTPPPLIPIVHQFEPHHLFDLIVSLKLKREQKENKVEIDESDIKMNQPVDGTQAVDGSWDATATGIGTSTPAPPPYTQQPVSISSLTGAAPSINLHEWHVHRAILAQHSSYFNAALHDTSLKILELPTSFSVNGIIITDQHMNTFIQQLYDIKHHMITAGIARIIAPLTLYFNCTILHTSCEQVLIRHMKQIQAQTTICVLDELISLLVLAERCKLPQLERDTMDAVFRHITGVAFSAIATPTVGAVDYVCPAFKNGIYHTAEHLMASPSFRDLSARQSQQLFATLIAFVNGATTPPATPHQLYTLVLPTDPQQPPNTT